MRKAILILIALAFLTVACSAQAPTSSIATPPAPIVDRAPAKQTPTEIVIDGPQEFQDEVKASFALLEEKVPKLFKQQKDNIRSVQMVDYQYSNGAAWAGSSGDIYIFSGFYDQHVKIREDLLQIPFYPLPILLIHETTHLSQSRQKRLYDTQAAELEALKAGRTLLLTLDVPEKIIEQISGDHLL